MNSLTYGLRKIRKTFKAFLTLLILLIRNSIPINIEIFNKVAKKFQNQGNKIKIEIVFEYILKLLKLFRKSSVFFIIIINIFSVNSLS